MDVKATVLSLFFLAALLYHVHRGEAACALSDIHVSVQRTGKLVEGQAEYQVTVDNACSCPQSGVTVRCLGLSTVEPVDKSKISVIDGQNCLVAGGAAIARGATVSFTYAWKTPQDFAVVSAKPQC
ncbi:hypothetical protein E2562_006805 [Oryza meyeriana var. granulata]|uniref:LGC1 n=1 Tax=Oryza meyeriana var. granulata TaxID=110450 RepID=A0A6G1C3Q6_9ORYZ|nr:hypothetical protein E2562_006805 [Oryza meyeriana var. granulata]